MRIKMLVTEDDPSLRRLYQTLFKGRAELDIDYAESPAACRARLEATRYDLALLDISLGDPAENGIDLLEWIHATRPETDVLMMSSMDEDDTVRRCLSLGARAFTSKNRDFAQHLNANVTSCVAQRHAYVS